MQLFILKLNEDESFSQFTTTAMLVRASDAVEARSIATEKHGHEGRAAWTDPKRTSCKLANPHGNPCVLLVEANGE